MSPILRKLVCVCVCVCVPVTGPVWPRGVIEIKLYSSMATALEGGEWSAARPGIKKSTKKKNLPNQKHLYVLFIISKPQNTIVRSKKIFLYFIRVKQYTN